MSATGSASRRESRSTTSKFSSRMRRRSPLATAPTPEVTDAAFEPCAATASFLLYAQRNLILVLHHDTLAIERRFDLHREDVVWVTVDNSSERGSGRLAVSYDVGHTAIVWDILTGGEVARFSAYENMRIACFMRNGNIAFGNDQGNIILFEPSTSEHISARTIFDPITALAPANDCHTFAIGYHNGSILVATLQPSFTILHTLTTTRAPARITGLAWHGSSSKQKTDMLASQTCDGDLRVWSVPKGPSSETPNIIRVLQRPEAHPGGPCWFAWSKNGRLVQHSEGETRAWDVRTKKVSWEPIPTVDGVIGIANFGPSATLFTLSRGHCVQQYDMTPNANPMQVASVQHVPANTPPTPPTILDEQKNPYMDARAPSFTDTDESGAEDPRHMSPRIARELDSLDALESELRDKVMPLSPSSSRASSQSSRSSRSRRRDRKYLYDQPDSSRASTTSGYDGTEFSISTPLPRQDFDNMSIRSMSSYHSAAPSRRQSNMRRDVLQSQNANRNAAQGDLFPFIKARLQDIPFRTPHYGSVPRTPELLQREMLISVFGWSDTVQSLIQDEMERHPAGDASTVLLSKWLGNNTADSMASMMGSDSMSSAGWMLLALSSIGPDSQKKVGETFVQRLLEKGDIHPAVGILIGLGEINDAIEVYVSQKYWLEAVLLICLFYASDWQRISYLLRKWGETAVQQGQAELAVRLFSCTSFETSEAWFSPRAQDAVFTAQQDRFMQPAAATTASPPVSPPSRSASGRLTAKNASLRLITTFGDQAAAVPSATDDRTPMQRFAGVTPIAQSAMPFSAMSPTAAQPWRSARDPVSARTMTPGTQAHRKRIPSIGEIERAKLEAAQLATPITAAREAGPSLLRKRGHSRRTSSISSLKSAEAGVRNAGQPLPSPAQGVFARLREQSESRPTTKDRKPDGLIVETHYADPMPSSASHRSMQSDRLVAHDPALAQPALGSARIRAIDEYINSVESAREAAREERAQSRRRADSKRRDDGRGSSRPRDASESRGTRYINSGKRSPSSPIPMSPEEIAEATKASRADATTADGNRRHSGASVAGSHKSMNPAKTDRRRPSIDTRAAEEHYIGAGTLTQRPGSADGTRGRSHSRNARSNNRSPSASAVELIQGQPEADLDSSDRSRRQHRSRSRHADGSRAVSRSRRERSTSRAPSREPSMTMLPTTLPGSTFEQLQDQVRPRLLSKKQLAAKELEDRRLSLARRPSAPAIPMPGQFASRPSMTARAVTDQSPMSFMSPFSRSASVDPEQMSHYNKTTGISTSSAPIGLPATPRAMRHPRHMGGHSNELDDVPPVPSLPEHTNYTNANSALPTLGPDHPASDEHATGEGNDDAFGPLLPATVFGQKTVLPPPRAATAPPEKMAQRGHTREKSGQSPPRHRQSIGRRENLPDEPAVLTLPSLESLKASRYTGAYGRDDDDVIIVPEPENPPVLPELQHLAGPPPPPPPPPMFQSAGPTNGSGLISIAIDDNATSATVTSPAELLTLPSSTFGHSIDRASTVSPTMHRKGSNSVNDAIGSRFRGFGDRMRSSSRNRSRTTNQDAPYRPAPYESVPPSENLHRAKSPYEKAMAAQQNAGFYGSSDGLGTHILPPTSLESRISERVIPPSSLPNRSGSAAPTYRNPKELRANMPPETTQQGVDRNAGGFL